MAKEDPIRVLVVDDTVTYRKIVGDLLAGLPGIQVVGTAANGKLALQRIEQLHPDLLTLDLEMPEMDGLEVLRKLQEMKSEVRAIMLTGATKQGANLTMTALELGAFDFVLKPSAGTLESNTETLRSELGSRVQAFARTKSVQKILRAPTPGLAHHHAPAPPAPKHIAPSTLHRIALFGAAKAEVVALGISTGGPASLTKMLPLLPANLNVPVLIVQHMPPVFTKSLAEDLDKRCALRVHEAYDGQIISKGNIFIAPGGKQMKIRRTDNKVVVSITDDPPENSCKPSVDYLFRSVCDVYGGQSLGVIMTGMGSDGTRGCRDLKRLGAAIIAQNESSCVVYGMPKAPIDEGLADVIAPLDGIASEIVKLVKKGV